MAACYSDLVGHDMFFGCSGVETEQHTDLHLPCQNTAAEVHATREALHLHTLLCVTPHTCHHHCSHTKVCHTFNTSCLTPPPGVKVHAAQKACVYSCSHLTPTFCIVSAHSHMWLCTLPYRTFFHTHHLLTHSTGVKVQIPSYFYACTRAF